MNINDQYKKYREDGRIEFITFHPSYSYEEFVEGITVKTEKENVSLDSPKYMLKRGIFKEMCKRALELAIGEEADTWQGVYNKYLNKGSVDFSQAPKVALIIDEINRGDISKIFGELITLLEADKRLGEDNEIVVKLPGSNDQFGVPPNLYIIATMNTADRSIALLDVALRRRFGFIEMNSNFDILRKEHIEPIQDQALRSALEDSIDKVETINTKLCEDRTIGRDKQIGHSFFFKVESTSDLLMVWKYEILPLLEEYSYGDYNKINRMLFDSDTSNWISNEKGIVLNDNNDLNAMLSEIDKNG